MGDDIVAGIAGGIAAAGVYQLIEIYFIKYNSIKKGGKVKITFPFIKLFYNLCKLCKIYLDSCGQDLLQGDAELKTPLYFYI